MLLLKTLLHLAVHSQSIKILSPNNLHLDYLCKSSLTNTITNKVNVNKNHIFDHLHRRTTAELFHY